MFAGIPLPGTAVVFRFFFLRPSIVPRLVPRLVPCRVPVSLPAAAMMRRERSESGDEWDLRLRLRRRKRNRPGYQYGCRRRT